MWRSFHHPDISLPVVRHRIGAELLEMLEVLGDVPLYGAWAFLKNRSFPDKISMNRAVYRLSKQGLIVESRGLGAPRLQLSAEALSRQRQYADPSKWWKRPWDELWYILMFDIPEEDRSYRNTLREFMKSQRMGCFQKSVWVTSHDIRPQYADLLEAAALGSYACLFEARTVLGMQGETVVNASWDMDSLFKVQKQFCIACEENVRRLKESTMHELEDIMRLAADETDAFRSAFLKDPLLPMALHPDNYMGRKSYDLHQKLIKEIKYHLKRYNPN